MGNIKTFGLISVEPTFWQARTIGCSGIVSQYYKPLRHVVRETRDPVLKVWSKELIDDQQRLLSFGTSQPQKADLRLKLVRMGMSESQVRYVEQKEKIIRGLPLYCRHPSYLTDVLDENSRFTPGTVLFKAAPISQVGVEFKLPAQIAMHVEYGTLATIRVPSWQAEIKALVEKQVGIGPFQRWIWLSLQPPHDFMPLGEYADVFINVPKMNEDFNAVPPQVLQVAESSAFSVALRARGSNFKGRTALMGLEEERRRKERVKAEAELWMETPLSGTPAEFVPSRKPKRPVNERTNRLSKDEWRLTKPHTIRACFRTIKRHVVIKNALLETRPASDIDGKGMVNLSPERYLSLALPMQVYEQVRSYKSPVFGLREKDPSAIFAVSSPSDVRASNGEVAFKLRVFAPNGELTGDRKIAIVLWDKMAERRALTIPISSVVGLEADDGSQDSPIWWVLIHNGPGKLTPASVELGEESDVGRVIEVIWGLKEDEQVIVDLARFMKDVNFAKKTLEAKKRAEDWSRPRAGYNR